MGADLQKPAVPPKPEWMKNKSIDCIKQEVAMKRIAIQKQSRIDCPEEDPSDMGIMMAKIDEGDEWKPLPTVSIDLDSGVSSPESSSTDSPRQPHLYQVRNCPEVAPLNLSPAPLRKVKESSGMSRSQSFDMKQAQVWRRNHRDVLGYSVSSPTISESNEEWSTNEESAENEDKVSSVTEKKPQDRNVELNSIGGLVFMSLYTE